MLKSNQMGNRENPQFSRTGERAKKNGIRLFHCFNRDPEEEKKGGGAAVSSLGERGPPRLNKRWGRKHCSGSYPCDGASRIAKGEKRRRKK